MLGLLLLIETEEDRISFEDMYKRTYLRLLYVAKSILLNQPDAEEAVHDVYVKLAANLSLYRGWPLYEITGLGVIMTRNLCLNRIRSKRRHRESPIEICEYICGEDDTVLDDIVREETLDELKCAIRELERKEKDILVLRYYYKFSYKQIGKVFDMKEKTVEVRLRRTKAKLRNIMEKRAKKQ